MMKAERTPKGQKSPQYRGVECLNCGYALNLSDRFCPNCGQLNSTKKLNLGDYLQEFIFSVFVYDSKIRSTLTDLLFHPGRVSLNYSQGKRQRYANPFRFFLSVSILYFLLSGLINFFDPPGEGMKIGPNNTSKPEKIKLDSTQQKYADYPGINEVINDIRETKEDSIETQEEYTYIPPTAIDTMGLITGLVNKTKLFNQFYSKTAIKTSKPALDSLHYPNTRVNRWLYSRNATWERIQNDPLTFIGYLKGKIPFFLFFFTPIFALFFMVIYFKRRSFKQLASQINEDIKPAVNNAVAKIELKTLRPIADPFAKAVSRMAAFPGWLFYVKRKFNYMDHVIFIFHGFTFMFVVLLFCEIPDYLLEKYTGEIYLAPVFLTLVVPFYFYKALHNFYGERRWLTIPKFIFLIIVFLIIGGAFAGLFFAATAVAY